LSWSLVLAHCPSSCHEHVIDTFTGSSGQFTAPDHEYPSHLIIRLTAADPNGGTDTTQRTLQPRTVTLRLRSDPPGLAVGAGATSRPTPWDLTVISGSSTVLSAPSTQVVDGFTYVWRSWSQGGARIQTVDPTASVTFTARFDGGFDDVPPGASFATNIAWLFNEGITVGCDDSPPLFCPNGLVTRGQMATFLTRALTLPATSTDYFTDDEGSVHEANINRLRAAGITAGCGPTTFCPNGIVTRGQMAAFLHRGLGDEPSN
jgi:hypothetical protein